MDRRAISAASGREGADPIHGELGAAQVAGGPSELSRAQAVIGGGGAIVGAFGVLFLPHPDAYVVPGILAVQALAIITALSLYAWAGRIPTIALRGIPNTLGTLMTTAVVYMSGSAVSPFVLFYLWTGMYSFYFLSRREAFLHIVFTAVNYVAVALALGVGGLGPEPPVAHMVLVVIATLGSTGMLQVYMRVRVEDLLTSLSEAAATDLLTGLPNRRGISDLLEGELIRARISDKPLGVVVGDIDGFKRFNEEHGQAAGDRALETIGELLAGAIGPLDRVGRTGAGEFTLVLAELGQSAAADVASKMLGLIKTEFARLGTELTMSFGAVTFPDHLADPERLYRAADTALLAAKVLGRNRVTTYSSQVEELISRIDAKQLDGANSELATVLGLAEALDMREGSTAKHSQTVGTYCGKIAAELGLEDKHVERVRLAGVLHDIGKIAIPDSVLRKPGPLTVDEYEHMKRHPEIGARMLAASELSDIREWVLAHHERPDGNGYPHGLTDEDVPLEARILAVGDAYEAMTSDRVYRKAPGHDFAIRELRREAGTWFDVQVVAALERVLDRERPAPGAKPLEKLREQMERGAPARTAGAGYGI